MRILITGGTGLVGKTLVQQLRKNGHTVHVLVRKESKNKNEFLWDYANKFIDEKALKGIDVIVHLAGATIAKRWTNNYKKEIISSRVTSALFLKEECEKRNIYLKAFVSASGTNFYGTFTCNDVFNEENPTRHKDFLSDVCNAWEEAAKKFENIAERTVIIRTSPVFAKYGGSFVQLKKISDFNLASGVGSGKQWFPWIHIEDLVRIYVNAVENLSINGIYNAAADEMPSNQLLMKKIAKANGKLFLPINVPALALKLMLGEMSEMLLKGCRVSNEKIKSEGFEFQYPDLDTALKNLL